MQIPYVKTPWARTITCHTCQVTNEQEYVHPYTPGGLHCPPYSEDPICKGCFQTLAAKEHFRMHKPLTDLPTWVDNQLKSVGLSAEERRADVGMIPKQILDAFPEPVLLALMSGNFPKKNGLGLGGVAGYGKSSALAALLRFSMMRNVETRTLFMEAPRIKNVVWMNVPLTLHRWRLNGIDPGIVDVIDRASSVKLLILDDLSRETRRREAAEDVATGHLNTIITSRDREGLRASPCRACRRREKPCHRQARMARSRPGAHGKD